MDARGLYHEALRDYRERRVADAERKLARALELEPAFEDALEALSVLLYNEKRYDEAIAVLGRWAARNPDAVLAHTNLSRCYVAKGMIAEAEREQGEARRLTWKAELKGKRAGLPKIDREAQIARFKKVIELDPADVLGYFSLATAYAEAGQNREAAETFERAIGVDGGHSASYLGLGLAWEALGDPAKARAAYEKGIGAAGKKGDVMTLKKMEARLRGLAGK